MLDRGTSHKKDPLASLSRKKIHGHDHLNISVFKKKTVFRQSFVYESICTVFTILYLGSLHIYIYIIIRIYGLYLVISKVSTFPCPFKKQWLSAVVFLKRMKKGLYQERSASKIATQGVFPK